MSNTVVTVVLLYTATMKELQILKFLVACFLVTQPSEELSLVLESSAAFSVLLSTVTTQTSARVWEREEGVHSQDFVKWIIVSVPSREGIASRPV